MTPPPRTTIVTVAYNSTEVLPAMLASVPAGLPVVLVDNGSADLAEMRVLAARTGARLVENGRNLGFGPACNVGAAQADTEFLLFLNPDTVLAPDATARLETALDRHPTVSAANPRLSDGAGRAYFKRRSVLLRRREWLAKGWPAADRQVPVLSGAALFVRRAAFTRVGGFDPRIFLYHEDDDLSLRLRADCGPLLFVRDAEVRHLEGRSTVRSAASAALKARHMGWSRVYAARKHHLPLAATRALASAAGQLLLPVNWLSARRRAKQWAFMKGVVSGLAG